MSQILSSLRATLRDPHTREFLLWLLPALLVGLIVRIVLTAHLPFGYYHDDTPDFLTTPEKLLFEHRFELHVKKTFLVPCLISVPFFLHLPALIAIPVFQHLLGLGTVALVGLLCRLWFRMWKVFIIPLTVLTAINPFLLWYEHTIMAEAVFVFTTLLVALALTLYTLGQSRGRFIFLLAALVLEAGARPEGKLLFGVGILLVVLLHARAWRSAWPRLVIVLAVAALTNQFAHTSQAGLLLYTSVARLTPRKLACAPGFEPYIAPLRADLQKRWEEKPSFPKVRDRRAVAAAVESYFKDTAAQGGRRHRSVNEFCKRLAAETCLKNFGYLPIHIYHKFRETAWMPPSGWFDREWLFDRQRDALEIAFARTNGTARTLGLAYGLTGAKITTEPGMYRFFETHYVEVPWFNALERGWLTAVNYFHLPDLRVPNPEYPLVPLFHKGIPYYFLAAAIGLIAVAFRRDRLQVFHIVWGLTLLGFFYTIILTANVKPRFRVVFEPFWFIYLALLIECAWLAITAPLRRRS